MESERSSDAWMVAHGDTTGGILLPRVARASVLTALRIGQVTLPGFGPDFLNRPYPVFVTLRDARGALRGCVGALRPHCRRLVDETWRLAREAAFSDSRFRPVTTDEALQIRFEVSVLGPLEAVASPSSLDPEVFGVVVSTADGRRGVLLPAIEGVDSVACQLRLARQKGGISPVEPARIQCFRVERFLDPATGLMERDLNDPHFWD